MRQRSARLYSVDALARETMLLTAEPRLKPVASLPVPRVEIGQHWESLDAVRRPIWEWEAPRLDEVRNVSVRQASMQGAATTVCTRIVWGSVHVVTKRGGAYELPLTDEFLIRNYFLDDGEIPDMAAGLWQLPANLHNSYQRIFGYQVDLVTGRLCPLPKKALDNPELFYPSEDGFAPRAIRDGDVIVRVPLRLLVCVTLGCATERNDFEPSGALGAARLYPMTLLLTNRDLDVAEAEIYIERPAATAQCHMEGEQMTPTIGGVFFTDRNGPLNQLGPLPPFPYWDNFFDYYMVTPSVGESVVMVRSGVGERMKQDAVRRVRRSEQGAVHQAARAIHKMAGQGEFDNLHLAPKMVAPAEVVRRNPNMASTMREIAMAPFCIHDCLHTHVRWGTAATNKSACGWSGTAENPGEPSQIPGAPLVPPNQEVTIKLLTPSSFRYTAKIRKPAAAQWQPIFHHGSAYALTIDRPTELKIRVGLQATQADYLGDRLRMSWAMLYWSLRYFPVGDTVVERLQLSETELRALRTL
jgi:hypothetical protein